MILERKSSYNIDAISRKLDNPLFSDITVKKEMLEGFGDVMKMSQIYRAAIREISTKLEILDDEFHVRYSHSPIHHIESRLKSLQSILEKLSNLGAPLTVCSAMERLTDIAGIRVVCNYIEDIYTIVGFLEAQSDIQLIRKTDYIADPKPSGY